jgi:hypothetical protein
MVGHWDGWDEEHLIFHLIFHLISVAFGSGKRLSERLRERLGFQVSAWSFSSQRKKVVPIDGRFTGSVFEEDC